MSFINPKLDWKASDVVLNEDFNRIEGNIDYLKGEVHKLNEEVVPSGLISMWSGLVDSIPIGWLLCDGSNGTPDLRDRFIIGAGNQHDIGDSGGANEQTLSINNLPKHNHSVNGLNLSSGGSHTHTITHGGGSPRQPYTYMQPGGATPNLGTIISKGISTAGSHSHTISGTLGSTGEGQPFDNKPLYYSMAYIMKS